MSNDDDLTQRVIAAYAEGQDEKLIARSNGISMTAVAHMVERAFQEQHTGRKTGAERAAEVQRRFKRDSINWLILTVGVTLGGGLLLALGVASEFPPLALVGYIIAVVGGLMFTFRFLTAAIAIGVRQGLELSRRSHLEPDPNLTPERPDVH